MKPNDNNNQVPSEGAWPNPQITPSPDSATNVPPTEPSPTTLPNQEVTATNLDSSATVPQETVSTNLQENPTAPNPAESIAQDAQPNSQPTVSTSWQPSNPATIQPNTSPNQNQPQPATAPNGNGFVSFNSGKIKQGRGRNRSLLFAAAAAAFLILAGSAGYVFGYYLPNKPENVWSTGLDRSGKALEKVVEESTKKESLDKIGKSQITASLDVKGNGADYSGTFDMTFDDKKTNGKLTVSDNVNGDSEQKLSLDIMSELADKQTYPDTYFKFNGLTAFGLDQFIPGLQTYENKWIFVESKYVESLIKDTGSNGNEEQLTAEDVSELSKAFLKPTNEYLFTNDEKKAVLVRKSIVGPEKVDDMNTVHYKAGINKNNAKSYCEAVVNALYGTQAAKKLIGSDQKKLDDEKKSSIDSCKKTVDDDIKDSDEFDVWIDKKYKLIYKLRFYDESNKSIYTDIGQKYKGGDQTNFFIDYRDSESKSEVDFDLLANLKTTETTGELKVKFGEGEEKITGNLKITAKPYNGEVKVDKPKDTIPVKEMLEKLGFGSDFLEDTASSTGGTTINDKAEDSERQTDILAIHSQLEAYYAQYGYYPGLSDMNNSGFVSQYMVGLVTDALKDPDGQQAQFTEAPVAKKSYGYAAKSCKSNGKECQAYSLSVMLSTGKEYKKENLN